MEQFRHKWDFVDVDFFFASTVAATDSTDSSQSNCYQIVGNGSRKEDGQGIRFPNRKLDGSPDFSMRNISELALVSRRKHLNVASIEGDLPNGTTFLAGYFHVVGSPAMFGTPIPSFDAFAKEAITQNIELSEQDSLQSQDNSLDDQSKPEPVVDGNVTEEQKMLDVDVLVTNLTMVSPFYYGCEDPLDLDPSLERHAATRYS